MTTFLAKPAVKIVITDSGLGGLSVCAELARNLTQRGGFEAADIVCFDARPEQRRGYNMLPDMAEKTRVFNCALEGMQRLQPDAILIACNTLSVLYEHTPFSRLAAMPVVDIIDFGVELMQAYLQAAPAGRVIIFGTPTTIEANTHAARLIARGIAAGRIIAQPCDRLAGEIENGPERPLVAGMIEDYVRQAAARLPDRRQPLAAALCCTHFGYSRKLFEKSLARHAGEGAVILNPNRAMSACLAGPPRAGTNPPARISVTMVSKTTFADEKIRAISRVLEPISPITAAALRQYRYDPGLFVC